MTENGEHLFAAYLKDLAIERDHGLAHEADALLLTCMDFRFFVKIAEMMKGIKYDHVILAGAALGAVVPGKDDWHRTFFDHLKLAEELHHIKRVIVLEHRECGAYGPRGFGLLPDNPDRETEKLVHEEQVATLKVKIPDRLRFCSFLMDVPPKTDALTFEPLCPDTNQ